jgi:alpha-L-fucosidase 2
VVQRIKKALPNLPPVKVARDGTIMEWVSACCYIFCLSFNLLADVYSIAIVFLILVFYVQAQDFQDPEVHHRHVSHLFGLYPGHTMSLEQTPDLCKAVANSLYKRGTCFLNINFSTV